MIKVLANKHLSFENGERNEKGELKKVKTVIGFCELPDWVAEHPFFKLAIKDHSLTLVSQDSTLSDAKKIARLEKELADIKLAKEKEAETVTSKDFLEETPKVIKEVPVKKEKAKK